MSQNRNYRRDGGRQSFQGSGGGYGGPRNPASHMNPWEGGMVPGRGGGGGGGVSGLLPTPPQTNLLSQLSSPEAQLALASNLLSTLLRPQQQQVPSLLSLGAMNQGGGGGGGPGYHPPPQFGPNRFQDRRMKGGRNDGRRMEPYTKPGQARRGGGGARPGGDRKPGQGLRSPNLGKGRPIASSKDGGKAGKKDDEKSESDQDKDKSSADPKDDDEDFKREGDAGRKKYWKKGDDKEYDDDEDEDSKYAGIPSVLFYCHVCKKHMWDGHSFENHLKGRTHVLMMEKLEESYKIKVELMRHEQKVAEQQREIEMDRMKRQGKKFHLGVQEFCTMCDLSFFGSLVTHRKQEKHQQLKSFLHPRCLPCAKEFPTRVEWDHHKLTPYHLKKAAEARKKRIGGSDDEFTLEDFISQETGSYGDMLGKEMKVRTREQEENDIKEVREKVKDKDDEGAEKAEGEGEGDKTAENNTAESKPEDGQEATEERPTAQGTNASAPGNARYRIPKYNPDTPVGQQLLKELTGHLCRACQRFFRSQDDALTHCRTLGHYNNFIALLKTQARAQEAKERREAQKRIKDDVKKEKPETGGEAEKRSAVEDSVDDEGNWKRRKVMTSKNLDDSDVVLPSKKSDDEGDSKADEGKEDDGDKKYDPYEAEDSNSENPGKDKNKKPVDTDDPIWEEVDRDLGNLLDSVDVEQEGEEEAPAVDKGEKASRGAVRGHGGKGNVAIRSRAGRRRK
ncbi:zinc finger protein on ecdysone puffs isoform X2 [Bacillus rossius redtenbacheri]|uniref:zinc finger protein on ecdysone puffs isoform X2 n=1 Tax=Bacillus rossius redtenbacheri TaxID=93214 RepID=UPI002FDE5403